MKLALVSTLKNGALWEWLHTNGWSQRRLAQAVGVKEITVSSWMRLHSFPHPSLHTRIEKVTGRLFEDLFPADLRLLRGVPKTTVTVRDVSRAALLAGWYRGAAQLNPERKVLGEEAEDVIGAALDCLRPKERMILECRFGFNGDPLTLEETGKVCGLSRERIRGIESQALRKLRHPRIAGLLRAYEEDVD